MTSAMNELDFKRLLYPRVSDIIGKQNIENMRGIPLENLIKASERGTKVHSYCTAVANKLYLPEIEESLVPYVDAWKKWSSENLEQLVKYNERLYDDNLCFSGEFDMIVKLKDGRVALVDLKTSAAKSITWPVQVAAYMYLCMISGYSIDEVMILHFVKNSKKEIKIKEISYGNLTYGDMSEYLEIFTSSLKCYNYFYKKEKIESAC